MSVQETPAMAETSRGMPHPGWRVGFVKQNRLLPGMAGGLVQKEKK
jgi:hypothetical protein